MHEFFRPRLNAGEELRGRVVRVEGRIATLRSEIRTHERTIHDHAGRTSSEARAAVREARKAIAAARTKIAEEERNLPGLRDAYKRYMTTLERDINARLARELPNAERELREVEAEAHADFEALRTGPTEDVHRAYGAPNTWRRWLNDWNPLDWGGADDLATDRRVARLSEAERSTTIYRRLRDNFEALRPRATERLGHGPAIGYDE